MDWYLVCDRFDWRNENIEFGTSERWCNNLGRWHHPHRYLEFKYIKISEIWKTCQSVSCQKFVFREFGWVGAWGVSLCVCLLNPYRFSLFLVQLYAVWTSNNKCLLIVDGKFLFLSCQHQGNFVSMDHLDRQKKFQMVCGIPCLWIFQTRRGHRLDW